MQKMTRKQWNRLKAKAKAGDSEAQWEIGSWLEDGLADPKGRTLVRPDARAAARWYRQSASRGNAAGQIHLGVCLCAGRGIRRDDTEALRWFKRALRQGDPCAPNNIASVYRDRGNNRLAMFWYQRAVACGDADALVEVGRGCYAGVGVRSDAQHAVRCFYRAVASKNITQAGREDAMFHIGVAFHEGRGVKKSNTQAVRWLARANHDDDHGDARSLLDRIATESRAKHRRP
jgi:TPR repeat protein